MPRPKLCGNRTAISGNEGRHRQAQDGIVATKLLASVLTIIRNDVDNLKQLLDQPRYTGTNRIVPPNYRQLISKPPLNIDPISLTVIGSPASTVSLFYHGQFPC
jgi:hypothetical protein